MESREAGHAAATRQNTDRRGLNNNREQSDRAPPALRERKTKIRMMRAKRFAKTRKIKTNEKTRSS